MKDTNADADVTYEVSKGEVSVFYDIVPGSAKLGRTILRMLHKASVAEGRKCGLLNIIIADDNALRKLNRSFRNKNETTDVLSFNLADESHTVEKEQGGDASGLSTVSQTSEKVEGDIYISRERAAVQAAECGDSIEVEILRLVAHGFLHLCGWQHENDASLSAMLERGERLVKTVIFR